MSRPRACRTRRFRRTAVTMLETATAMFLLAVTAAAAAQLSAVCNRQQRTLERRSVALQVAASVVERWQAADWERTSPPSTADLKLPEWAAERLPGGRLVLQVDEVDEPRPGRRLRVQVAWAIASPAPRRSADDATEPAASTEPSTEASVELSGWRFAP